ncbi:uncharacterized protein T551_02965 [Pneumocystis jirovecii RU7]|uniref:Meiotic nuclear division protein 1 n=1 Tax=Pneumocystis jirovecii (strain RU7) TaxID=1408657 RepID=A0A0W4ZGI0_PNEJ7|nr:uncharacterized protein T551_02965 [Pneumocystis jirovecii RU7]KTW27466.1 hypothetical protein T551_02965 [Pneumocystis jirovecii RU7]
MIGHGWDQKSVSESCLIYFNCDQEIMSKKNLSLAEKRSRLEELFHESKEFFQLKEIEKKGYQEKKIVLQSIKDILQSLVDDGIVKMDKIGTTNYFWSFPSEARQSRQLRITTMEKQLETLQTEARTLQNQINQEMNQREDSQLRTSLLKNVTEKEKKHMEIVKNLERYRDLDPTVIEAKKKATQIAKDAANRWTGALRVFLPIHVN